MLQPVDLSVFLAFVAGLVVLALHWWNPLAWWAARRLQASGFDFDLIDAHYFYPDGVAAVMIGRALGKPVTITARGTDINLIPNHALPRRLILQAADRCGHMITVCQALKTCPPWQKPTPAMRWWAGSRYWCPQVPRPK